MPSKYRCLILVAESFVFLHFFDLMQNVSRADFVGKVAGEEEVVVAGAFALVVEAGRLAAENAKFAKRSGIVEARRALPSVCVNLDGG